MFAGLLSAFMFSACDADSIKNSIGVKRPDDSGRNPDLNKDPAPPASCTIYLCGLTLQPDSTRLLSLLKDNEVLLQFPCTDQTQISPDPDCHFIFGKDLYTTWQGDGKTVIKRNGELLYSFNEAEYVKDLILHDGNLWSLSINSTAGGFKLRRNDEIIFSKLEGEAGELYVDRGNLCFNYFTVLDNKKTYHLVRNGNELAISATGELLDVRLNNGALWYLERTALKCTLRSAQSKKAVPLSPELNIYEGKIYPGAEGAIGVIRGKIRKKPALDKSRRSIEGIITPDTLLTKSDALMSYYYGKTAKTWRVAIEKKAGTALAITDLTSGEETKFTDMAIYGKGCACYFEDKLYVGISDPQYTRKAMIWSEEGLVESSFTGRITGLSIVAVP